HRLDRPWTGAEAVFIRTKTGREGAAPLTLQRLGTDKGNGGRQTCGDRGEMRYLHAPRLAHFNPPRKRQNARKVIVVSVRLIWGMSNRRSDRKRPTSSSSGI